jgi:hypothetical protein
MRVPRGPRPGLGGPPTGVGAAAEPPPAATAHRLTRRATVATPGARSGDGGGADTTTSGLARRVRGAQLPTTAPVQVRRGPAPDVAAPAVGPAPTPEERQSAGAVYSYLTSFNAGVQRGRDEARGHRGERR